jgi:predicted nucleic acid-binding protein
LGELEQALAQHAVVAVDTAPFIYLWERHPRYFSLSQALFRYLSQPNVRGITTVITLIEACIYPQRQGRLDLVAAYERSLLRSRQLQTLAIDAAGARQAVVLRAEYDIHVPDALQIGVTLEAGATAFVTNDRRLSRVQELKVLVFDDYAS